MSLSFLSSFFYSQKEELSEDELSDNISDGELSVEELNEVFRDESENNYKNLIGYTDDPIVSSDVIGREETMVFDAKASMLTSDELLKTLCWYDNGWGFSKRILDTISLYETGEDN